MFRAGIFASHRATIALIVGATTVTSAGAATYHRFTATTSASSGSGGATTTLQTTASGSALQGEVAASPNTSISLPFGVLGEYNPSGSTFGTGVLGISTTGYAVAAEALSAQPTMLADAGGTGIGLEALTAANSSAQAIYAEAKGTGDGIDAQADGTGVGLMATSVGTTGLVAISEAASGGQPFPSSEAALALYSGEGLLAEGASGQAAHPAVAVYSATTNTDLLGTFNASTATSESTAIETLSVTNNTLNRDGGALTGGSDLNVSGDVFVYGRIFQMCNSFPATASTKCEDVALSGSQGTSIAQPTRNGGVKMFSTRQTLPSVEDTGSAQLVNGRSYVRIDPAFAATMSQTQRYRVFVTPGGDSRGVYVTNRTPAGFEVRENAGGRSNLDFDYRIVAQPIGDTSTRLAAIVPERKLGEKRLTGANGATYLKSIAANAARRKAPAIPSALARLSTTTIR